MGTKATIRSSTTQDLISIPGICLGFHPKESCVVLGVKGTTVEFCIRSDLANLPYGEQGFLDYICAAVCRCQADSLAVFVFSADPLRTSRRADGVVIALMPIIARILLVDDERFWEVGVHEPTLAGGEQWDPRASAVMAAAVVEGVRVAQGRDEAVAEVRGPDDHARAEYLVDQAEDSLRQHGELDRHLLLQQFLTEGPLSEIELAELALLMESPDLVGDVFDRLDHATAPGIADRLAAARRMVPDSHAGGVLAPLALACWFASRGVHFAECLTQLERLAPNHPLLPSLDGLHRAALRPPHPRYG